MINKNLDKATFNIRLGKSTLMLLFPGGQVGINLDFEKLMLN